MLITGSGPTVSPAVRANAPSSILLSRLSQVRHVDTLSLVALRFLGAAITLTAVIIPLRAQGLPDGPGKDLVESICSECHTTERIAAQQLTKPQWADKVLEMLQEAPDVKQSERDKIVEYLSKNFPAHANVNKANAKELQATLEISSESAMAVVSYRQKNGSFKTLDDLKKVPGLEPEKLDSKREIIDFKE
jgi:competence protein ComEA